MIIVAKINILQIYLFQVLWHKYIHIFGMYNYVNINILGIAHFVFKTIDMEHLKSKNIYIHIYFMCIHTTTN